MSSEPIAPGLRLLLDEHYPAWLARALTDDGLDTVALVADRPELRGADDGVVLATATAEGRAVVTEDVTTFGAAIELIADHAGVLFCHHRRFPRTRPGLERLRRALLEPATDPPNGLGKLPIVWWLDVPGGGD